ncbi:hypothetical protein [Ancylobacter pratisalsi]|nr:hypothetical protein [Ancylobacter pratisalsi]
MSSHHDAALHAAMEQQAIGAEIIEARLEPGVHLLLRSQAM